MARSAPVKPTSGSWQAAQDCPDGSERLMSKNSILPSCSWEVRPCAEATAATIKMVTVAKMSAMKTFLCILHSPFSRVVPFIVRPHLDRKIQNSLHNTEKKLCRKAYIAY